MTKKAAPSAQTDTCPCGTQRSYALCCKLLHEGQPAASAETLMRSRYSAYALHLADYLLKSWHISTRPAANTLAVDSSGTRWLGLQIKRSEQIDESHALVEFVARYKVDGKAFRLEEASRFVQEDGHWFYLDALSEAST